MKLLFERSSGIEVVAEAVDGLEAVEKAAECEPDVVIIDIGMPRLNGIDATARIVKHNSRTAVIVLSMHSDESYILRALDAGARGYLLKDTADDYVEQAVETVISGKPFFTPSVAESLLDDYMRLLRERHITDSYDLLTDREKQVLQLLAEGKSNKEVAAVLSVSPYTIETHRTNLMQKLNLHNTAEIVLYAVRKAIIAP